MKHRALVTLMVQFARLSKLDNSRYMSLLCQMIANRLYKRMIIRRFFFLIWSENRS